MLQVALSTDMIVGFCGETEEDHADTLDLMTRTAYEQAFLFAYSQRDRTLAARHLQVRVKQASCCACSMVAPAWRQDGVCGRSWGVGMGVCAR